MLKKERRLLLMGICSVLITNGSTAQQKVKWEIQPNTIATRWAKEVDPNLPLSDYPRPQLVRENWYNLNGLWKFDITDTVSAPQFESGKEILVPFPVESVLSGVNRPLLPSQNLWYQRTFSTPKTTSTERVMLHFGAVDWSCQVYINDHYVGRHSGGYNSFSLDVTQYLEGKTNSLKVKVFDPSDRGVGPHGKQVLVPNGIYYTSSSGIWQTVWLETVPEVSVESLKMTPDVDRGELNLKVNLSGSRRDFSVESFVSAAGKEILKQVQDDSLGRQDNGKGTTMVLKLPNPHLWSPEDPFLYDLVVRLKYKGKVVDEVKSYFGMRKVAVQKDDNGTERIFLNNKPYFNLGTLDQGFWPDGLYTAPTDDALKFDIEAIKAMGFNTIRKHIKIEPARWYYHADKAGILVWQDFVNPNQGLPLGANIAFEDHLSETIDQLSNYPCISTWVIFNERWGQFDQERIARLARTSDSTRLINAHSGELLYVDNVLRDTSYAPYVGSDMTDVHSYPYPRKALYNKGKAMVVGEFGGIGVPIKHHIWNSWKLGWGYNGLKDKNKLQIIYKQMTDSLLKLRDIGLSGSIYTQPFDVEAEQNGLITYDRKVAKLPLETIRSINSVLVSSVSSTFDGKFISPFEDSVRHFEEYNMLKNRFQSGYKSKGLLYKLMQLATEMNDSTLISKAAIAYLDQIKEPITISDIDFVQSAIVKAPNPSILFVVNNIASLKILGDVGYSVISAAKSSISNEAKLAIFGKKPTLDVNALQNQFENKYGLLGRLVVLEESALYHYVNKHIDSFVIQKSKILALDSTYITNFTLANDAWFVFLNGTGQNELEAALEWSKKILREEPLNNGNMDTYANLLYKLGREKDALIVEEKAYKIDTDNQEIKSNYEKMKHGKPTWTK